MNILAIVNVVTSIIAISIILGYTGYGVWSFYRYFFAAYHVRVADTKKAYLSLKFKNFKDELIIYTTCYGKELYLKCVQDQHETYSISYNVPAHYATPYEYVMSGDLNNDIRDLRLIVDMRVAADNPLRDTIQSDNYALLKEMPIEFEDVGDEIRKRLGVKT